MGSVKKYSWSFVSLKPEGLRVGRIKTYWKGVMVSPQNKCGRQGSPKNYEDDLGTI